MGITQDYVERLDVEMMEQKDQEQIKAFSLGCKGLQHICRSYLDSDPQPIRSGVKGPLLPHFRLV